MPFRRGEAHHLPKSCRYVSATRVQVKLKGLKKRRWRNEIPGILMEPSSPTVPQGKVAGHENLLYLRGMTPYTPRSRNAAIALTWLRA